VRFPLEPGQAVSIGGEELGEDLQRDIATEFGVACPIHLAHASSPQQANNLVRAKASAS
jgi:hypothetical protein